MHLSEYIEITILPLPQATQLKEYLTKEGVHVHFEQKVCIQRFFIPRIGVFILKVDVPVLHDIMERDKTFKETYAIDAISPTYSHAILVPTDFSDSAWNACQFAFHYAAAHGFSVTLLHVYFTTHLPYYFTESDATLVEEVEIREDNLQYEQVTLLSEQYVTKIGKAIAAGELPDVPFEFVIREGVVEEQIRAWCGTFQPLLVVMGTRGTSEKANDLIGSVTAEVVEVSSVPVLAIHKDITYEQFKQGYKMAFVTNLEERDLISYDHFTHLAEFSDKETVFFVIADKLDDAERVGVQQRLDHLVPSKANNFDLLDAGDLLQSILHQVAMHEVDIIVIPTHKRNIFVRLFKPSMAHQIVFNSDIALLSIHD